MQQKRRKILIGVILTVILIAAAGLIFSPGAKVQFESYAPLMQK